jgi:hypothetical protein
LFDLVVGGSGLAGVVGEDATVVGLLACDQAKPVPAFDALGVCAEMLGDLVQGEHAGAAEPLAVAAEAVRMAVPGDAVTGPAVAIAAAAALGVEDVCGLRAGLGGEDSRV